MEGVPTGFVTDVFTLLESPRPFLQLSGQWRQVALRRLGSNEKESTYLVFKQLTSRSEVLFGFGQNSLWDAFKKGKPETHVVDKIWFCPPGRRDFEDLKFYPLEAENTPLLTAYLRKRTKPISLYLTYSSLFDMDKVIPVLLSIPRISHLTGDYTAEEHSPCFKLLKHAVRRGTLVMYESGKRTSAYDDEYARTVREFVSSRRMWCLTHHVPDYQADQGSFLKGVLEAWIAKENCEKHTLKLGRGCLPLVKRVMDDNGFQWEESCRGQEGFEEDSEFGFTEVVLRKDGKGLNVRATLFGGGLIPPPANPEGRKDAQWSFTLH